MPKLPCAQCHAPADYLPTMSHDSPYVDYYRCPSCGYAWPVPKNIQKRAAA